MNKKNNNQAQATSSKTKTAGIFFGGFTAGGLVGVLGMHLYHKKRALDEMEEAINSSKNVPIDEESVSDPGDADFREVPEETVFTVFHEKEKKSCEEEAEPVNNEDSETSEKEGDSDEVLESINGEDSCEESPEVGNENSDEVPEQEENPEVPEAKKEEAPLVIKPVEKPEESENPIIHEIQNLLNDKDNIHDAVAQTVIMIVNNHANLTRTDKCKIRRILKNGGADNDLQTMVSFVISYYNATINTTETLIALERAIQLYDRITVSEEDYAKSVIKFAIGALKTNMSVAFIKRNNTRDLITIISDITDYCLKDYLSEEDFTEIIKAVTEIGKVISEDERSGKPRGILKEKYIALIESSGIKYTDEYYDSIYPLINNEEKAPLSLLMSDGCEVVNSKKVDDLASNGGVSDLSVSCLKAFPESIQNIETLMNNGNYAGAKEAYRDLILPITNDKNIVKEFPELNTIIRNIGDRITDMVIAEKQKATEEASSIGKEDTTNTGKTYPAKSKSKNKNRNRSRNNKAGHTQSGSAK